MAKLVLTNAQVLINAVDLSAWCKQVTINYSAAELDATVMGNTSIARLGGLKDWSMDFQFLGDEAASAVAQTIFPIVGTNVVVDVKEVSGARSTTNPSYTGTGLISSFSPIGQAVGAILMNPVKMVGANGTPLARATS